MNLVVGGAYKMYQVVRRHFACQMKRLVGGKTLLEAGINLVVGGTYRMYQVVRRHFETQTKRTKKKLEEKELVRSHVAVRTKCTTSI